jgi:hypothetical protein
MRSDWVKQRCIERFTIFEKNNKFLIVEFTTPYEDVASHHGGVPMAESPSNSIRDN